MRNFGLKLDVLSRIVQRQCELRQNWVLLGFSALYWTGTYLLASRKLVWNDELFTLYLSQLRQTSDLWAALSTGADQIPPLFYLITRTAFVAFGINILSVRLPEMLGFWVMALCLFRFVARRSSALHGLFAMLLPLLTAAYDYAYEARPYGIVLGFTALALLFWQSTTDGYYRKASLIGLGLALAAGVSTHYYAILVFIPLGLGELVRSIVNRRVDMDIWLAFASGLLPLFLFVPLLARATGYSGAFWARPTWRSVPEFYYFLLTPALLPLIGIILVSTLWAAMNQSRGDLPMAPGPGMPPIHEIIAGLGFILLPVVAVIFAMLVTHAFTYRYALPAVLGFSVLFPFADQSMLRRSAILGVFLIFAFCGGFVMLIVHRVGHMAAEDEELRATYRFLDLHAESGLPVVAADLHTFMKLKYYAPQRIRARLVYLADPKASLEYLGYDTVDRGILDLEPWFRLNVQHYRPYLLSHRRFVLYGHAGFLNWLFYELPKTKMRLELKGSKGDDLLFLVTVSDNPEP